MSDAGTNIDRLAPAEAVRNAGAFAPATTQPSALGLSLILIGLTALLFSPVLSHHFIESWDDTTAILTNPDYNPPSLGTLVHYWIPPPKRAFYVPVTYTLWGLLAMVSQSSAPWYLPFNPTFFYAANLAAHAISVGLVFLILDRLVPSRLAAALGAALFAVHPMQVEAVATASSVYTPLSGMFAFLAIWQYLAFSDRYADPNRLRGAWRHYLIASAAFVLAMLTKPTAVCTPLVILAIEFGLRRQYRRPAFLAATLVPWFVLALIAIALNTTGAPGATVFVPPPLYRPLVPLDAIGFYLQKFCFPFGLAPDYGRSPRWLTEHPEALAALPVLLAIGGFAWLARFRVPWLITAFAVFIAGLLPSIGIVPFDFQQYSTVADRYAYIALLGPALLLAFLLCYVRTAAWRGIALLAIAGLGTLSMIQLTFWRDDWHLMAHTLEVTPQSLGAANGFRYLLTGWHDDRNFPAPRNCTLSQPELVRVGDALANRHLWTVAAGAYRKALKRGKPTASVEDRLGAVLLDNFDPAGAAEAYTRSLVLDPHDAEAKRGLARARQRIGPAATTEPDAAQRP